MSIAEPIQCTELRNGSLGLEQYENIAINPNAQLVYLSLFYVCIVLICAFFAMFLFFKYISQTRDRYHRVKAIGTHNVLRTHFGACMSITLGTWFYFNRYLQVSRAG